MQLLSGERQRLVDSNGILQYYTTTGQVPDQDDSDYEVGPSVFWRNALHIWQSNPDLRKVLKCPDYQSIIKANADAAANEPTDGSSIEMLTNYTAVLVAATTMLVPQAASPESS